MTITLPDEMREGLERDARAAGFATVDEYVADVLRGLACPDAEDLTGMPVPDELQIKDRTDLEAKLLDGLNSGPPVPATPEYWADLRRRARERSAAGQKPRP